MRPVLPTILLPVLALAALPAQDDPAGYPLAPVPFQQVELDDGFWRPRLELQRRVLVPHAFARTEAAVAYLQQAADHLAGDTPAELRRPHRYMSSDLYKVMEGAAYLLALERDPELEARLERIARIIAAAQRDDGYLYCAHVLGHGTAEHMMGDGPYEFVVHSHELYNLGHLYEAAVAYYRATGERTLLDVAIKSAHHLQRVFFVGDPDYNGGEPVRQAPGHQEIELALVKLADVTGERAFLELARSFLDVRGVTHVPDGRGVMSPTYAQQHQPVAEQREAVGHAVRATYMWSGMADVDAMSGTAHYREALDAIWHDIVDRRMHLTGGLGAMHGIEGFGPPYELPNADCYNETCAAVGNVLFNRRMFLLHGDARYLDVAEVALFNNVLAGVSLGGDEFFYVNPLESDGETPFNHGQPERAPWFGTACCPTNLARLLPQIGGMLYATRDAALYATGYAGSATAVEIGGTDVVVEQHTAYPLDGRIELRLNPGEPQRFALHLRIPTWVHDRFLPGALYRYRDTERMPAVRIRVNDQAVSPPVDDGFAVLDRTWQPGDRVILDLPMPVRANVCDERVAANRGRVAFTRGPLVLCAEEVDNDRPVQRLFVPEPDAALAAAALDPLRIADGHRTLRVSLPARAQPLRGEPAAHTLRLLPYYAWNNRGVGSMIVWLPTTAELLPNPGSGLTNEAFRAIRASHTWSGDSVKAIGDGELPSNSADTSIPRWTSWPQRGEPQQVEIDFDEPRAMRSVGIYFYDDGGGVRLPESWSLEVNTTDGWQPFQLDVSDAYGTEADRFNVVHPAAPRPCSALRVRLTPRDDATVGILELQVVFDDAR